MVVFNIKEIKELCLYSHALYHLSKYFLFHFKFVNCFSFNANKSYYILSEFKILISFLKTDPTKVFYLFLSKPYFLKFD